MKTRCCPNSRHACRLALLPLAFALSSQGATYTWTGGATPDGNWSEVANWGGATVTSAVDSDLTFAGSTQLSSANNSGNPFQLRHLTFSSGSGAFTLSGWPLVVYGNLVNNATALQTLGNHVTLGANSQWNTAVGDLLLTGNLGPTNAFTFTKSGNKTLTFTGQNAIRLADKGITGGGTLVVAGGATTNLANGNLMNTSGGNGLIVTNGGLFATTVNTTVDNGGNRLIVTGPGSTFSGSGASHLYLNTDARLLVAHGAVVTNVNDFRIGDSGKARMSVVVTNGGHLCSAVATYRGATAFSVWVGAGFGGAPARWTLTGTGASLEGKNYNCVSNTITIDRNGVFTARGGINWGYAYQGYGQGNRLIVTNGGQASVSGGSSIGHTSARETLLWVGGADPQSGNPSRFNWNGAKCMIGHAGQSFSNAVVVAAGGVMTNANIVVGDDTTSAGNNAAFYSRLLVTDGGYLRGAVQVGVRSRRNTFLVRGVASRFDGAGATLTVGAAERNALIVDGGMVTNVNELRIGYVQAQTSYAVENCAVVTNGGRLFTKGTAFVGDTESYVGKTANSNSVVVAGSGSRWDLGGAALRVGYINFTGDSGFGNELRVNSGGAVTNVGAVSIGYAAAGSTSSGNRLSLGGGSLRATSLTLYANNLLAPVIGVDGVIPATFSGTATLANHAIISPSATADAPNGTYTVLTAGTISNGGLELDPAVDPAEWSFAVDLASTPRKIQVTFKRRGPPGTLMLLR